MEPRYRRMLKGMHENETSLEAWFLYILECADGTYYTGVTKDLKRRVGQHNLGKGARYTRTRIPVQLIYQEECTGRATALLRECAVKAMPRKQKELLVGRNS